MVCFTPLRGTFLTVVPFCHLLQGVPPLNRQELLRNNPNKEEIELYFKLTSPLETLEPEMASIVHNLRVLIYEFTPSHLRPRGH